ncbi:MAG: helix-turn-helix domain-containing protein [Oscillospiraceae bacterium]
MAKTLGEICNGLNSYDCEKKLNNSSGVVSVRYITKNSYSIYLPFCLYIGYASNMPEEIMTTETLNFLIIEDAKLPEYITSNRKFNSIIIKTKDVDLFALYNLVQNLLSIDPGALSCSYDMTKSLSRGESVQELLNITYQYLENPLMLTNLAQQHVAHSYGQTNVNEPVWEHYINVGYCSDEMVERVNRDTVYRKALSDGKYPVTIDYTDIMNYRQMTMPIRMDGINVAFLSVLEMNKPFTQSTGDILQVASKSIAIKISPSLHLSHSKMPEFDMLMQYILTAPVPNEVYVTLQLKRWNIELKRPFMLFSIEDTQGLDVDQKMPYITTVIDRFLPLQHAFLFENKTLVLYHNPAPPDILEQENPHREFDTTLRQYRLVCGVSRVFENISELAAAYDQTKKARLFGEIYKPDERVYLFDDYIMENLLNTFLEHDHINSLIDPKLRELIKNENQKSGELALTLRAYLQFDCDMRRASEFLHVHYNTLKYRLQRIKELYYMPLSDAHYIFQLKLSFLALDLNVADKTKTDPNDPLGTKGDTVLNTL